MPEHLVLPECPVAGLGRGGSNPRLHHGRSRSWQRSAHKHHTAPEMAPVPSFVHGSRVVNSLVTPRNSPAPPDLPMCALIKADEYCRACVKRGIVPVSRNAAARMISKQSAKNALVGDSQVSSGCAAGLLDGQQNIQLRDADIGEHGCIALGKALGSAVVSVDLAGNSIGIRGAKALGCAQMPNLEVLNLARNGLGDVAVSALCTGLVQSGAVNLCRVILSENQITRGGGDIGSLVRVLPNLDFLDLHWNYITGDSSRGLFNGIEQNRVAKGCLARLDLSWNCMSSTKSTAHMTALANTLRSECPLVHLDLSYNGLQPAECKVLAGGLRDNHTLLGLHLVGNAAGVDANGFIISLETEKSIALRPASAPKELLGQSGINATNKRVLTTEERRAIRAGFKRIDSDHSNSIDAEELQVAMGSLGVTLSLEEVKKIIRRKDVDGNETLDVDEFTALMESLMLQKRHKDYEARYENLKQMERERSLLEARTSCWICENWQPVCISWTGQAKAVWAFTSLDNFQRATRLTKDAQGHFSCQRMFPPDQVRVVLQVDNEICCVSGLPTSELAEPIEIRLRQAEELQTVDRRTVAVTELSVLELTGRCKQEGAGIAGHPVRAVVIDDPNNPGGICVAPRITETEFKAKQSERQWRFQDAIFAPWKFESSATHNSAFLADWPHCKAHKFLKDHDDSDSAAEALRSHYGDFIRLYRRCAASSSDGSSTFGVSMNSAADLLVTAGVVDDDFCRLSDVDTMFIAARVREKRADKHAFSVKIGDTLLRFQFLEFLLRVAVARFVKTHEVGTISEAIEHLFKLLNSVMSPIKEDLEQFHAAFHTEECDNVLRANESLLLSCYKSNSGRLAKPGEVPKVCCKEFESVLVDADVTCEAFPVRDIPYAFQMGMQLYTCELYSFDFAQMSFLEFLHGLGGAVFLRREPAPLSAGLAKLMENIADNLAANSLLRCLK